MLITGFKYDGFAPAFDFGFSIHTVPPRSLHDLIGAALRLWNCIESIVWHWLEFRLLLVTMSLNSLINTYQSTLVLSTGIAKANWFPGAASALSVPMWYGWDFVSVSRICCVESVIPITMLRSMVWCGTSSYCCCDRSCCSDGGFHRISVRQQ